uniref:Uncharacterized protein n=1 Tax=uncultured Desulfobacterium sp. TaxID=201089 RepID=E1YEY5_9BACT|nr:unknown protein [uncultured Desulfobacterium sp.]
MFQSKGPLHNIRYEALGRLPSKINIILIFICTLGYKKAPTEMEEAFYGESAEALSKENSLKAFLRTRFLYSNLFMPGQLKL